MTDEDLAAFEHLANNATPGPWTTEKPGKTDDGWSKGVRICAAMNNPVYGDPPGGQSPWADAQFIAPMKLDPAPSPVCDRCWRAVGVAICVAIGGTTAFCIGFTAWSFWPW